MPNRPIEFKFDSDVTKLLRGLDKAEISVEDLEDAIKKLPKASDKAADDIGDDFRRAGDDARDAGRDMGGNFRQSLGEGLSSGGADLSETISETLGEAVSEAPLPVALIAGLGIAAWGILKAESEKQKKELTELFDITDLITGAVDQVALLDEALIDLGGTKEEGLDKVKSLAKTLGLSIGEVTAMITGETNPATVQMVENLRASNRELNTQWLNEGKISAENRKIIEAQQTIIDQHKAQAEGLKTNAERANTYRAGLEGVQNAAAGINETMAHGSTAFLEKIQEASAIATNPKNWKIPLNFYATSELGQSLISGKNYSPGHVAIAQQQLRENEAG